MRRPLVFVLALLIVSGCSSSGNDTTTTADEATTTTADAEAFMLPTVDAMCHTLSLFAAATVPPATAADALVTVDLDNATSQEMADYGDLLIGAPSDACPGQQRYAEAIAYWLGF